MRRVWVIVVIVVVGAALGVAIAGVPTRHQDPPLRVSATPTDSGVGSSPAPTTAVPATTTTAPPHRPSDVGVLVINAAGLPGKGTDFTSRLRSAGFSTFPAENDNTDRPSQSVIEFAPGYQGDAVAVGSIVGIGPVQPVGDTPVPARFMGAADVLVVIGTDLH